MKPMAPLQFVGATLGLERFLGELLERLFRRESLHELRRVLLSVHGGS